MAETGPIARNAQKLAAAGAGLTIDIDVEPKLRKMTLFLSNTAGRDLVFRKRAPAPTYDGNGSLLRLFFEGYLGDLGLAGIRCEDPTWSVKTFTNAECDLAITPKEDLTLRDGQAIRSVLDGIESATTVRGTFVMAIHGMAGLEETVYRQITCAVRWETQGAHDLPLQVAFEQPSVVADGKRNELRLVVTNAQDKPLCCGDVNFELSFVNSPEPANQAEPAGALIVSNAEVTLESTGAASARWKVEPGGGLSTCKHWLLKAVRGDDDAVLGVGAAASVSFLIKGVVARRTGVSLASLRYRNVVGYGSGVFNLPILKKATAPGGVPRGTIVMWSGPINAIPEGWTLCDGTNDTPNLVSRFIMGAGKDGRHPKSEGGAEWHKHEASARIMVQSAGNHSHHVPSAWYANTASSGKGVTIVDRHSTGLPWTTQDSGVHSHGASSNVFVESASNLPPWVALCFIMKIA